MPFKKDAHRSGPVLAAGPSPEAAAATLVLLHGRGGQAENMLELFKELAVPDLSALAPQARGSSWYPQSFLAPVEQNQPFLDFALGQVGAVLEDLNDRGIQNEQIAILGFSQGACLACEFVARNPARYGAVMALTGGLIGPPGLKRDYSGTLDGTPVFLGTSDPDPHVPYQRVEETRDTLSAMGADVELRRYPGMPHIIIEDELVACRDLLSKLVSLGPEERSAT